ncbi:PH domain-containing protein [Nakamurella panacisegetis]|uniref:PH domain-containing protein n=1 Tax=Nakamurella panacisegetis TaxID=1090615 RepID=A0A1H0HY19_9ACTN|nr:PH domain-containing protein [Nakamurella panacisegetis]SDO24023.1 PH domain-containing protein [Nakamurella panacisegetis]
MTSPSVNRKAVFRLPGVSFLIPFLFFIAVTPLANAGTHHILLVLYLFPLIGLVYILITRTVADAVQLRTVGLLGARTIAWSELDGLEFHGPRWAIAVALDGRRLRLPMVRPRDLPRLAAVSGGRLLLGPDAPMAEDLAPVLPTGPATADGTGAPPDKRLTDPTSTPAGSATADE